ncbi:MAG: glycosyltransferase family 4 protein [Acetobacterales bacterium]
MFLAVLPLAALAGSYVATRLLIRFLRLNRILDRPNARSSHVRPVPRGGGIAVVAVTLAGWALALLVAPELIRPTPGLFAVMTGIAVLSVVSWVDDLHSLKPAPRLLAQALAVALGLWAMPGEPMLFQGLLPPGLDLAAAAVLWVWFVNLYNFMDGIDGLASSETVVIGVGLALLAQFGGVTPDVGLLGIILAAAALGFLRWNWQSARIFLGDVGSIPIGYMVGWLLLAAATQGAWIAALLLPLYFLADATLTLLRRLARGERVWHAHREHFFQRAVRRGTSHAGVVRGVILCNLVLVGLAMMATLGPDWIGWVALAGGFAAVGALLLWLGSGHAAAGSDDGPAL